MIIDCFVICWNEEVFLPYFLRHYAKFCHTLTVFDNESSDRSREICKDAGAKVITWATGGVQDNEAMLEIKNSCWKESDADYVIVCDIDEIIVGLENLPPLCSGRIMKCHGIQMVGQGEPTEQIRRAFDYIQYDKCAVFSPEISDIGFKIGCHENTPSGYTEIVKNTCSLLHYSLPSEDSVVARWQLYSKRMGDSDRKKGYAWAYRLKESEIRRRYRQSLAKAKTLPENILPSF